MKMKLLALIGMIFLASGSVFSQDWNWTGKAELSLTGIQEWDVLKANLEEKFKSKLLVETAGKEYLPMIDGSSSLAATYLSYEASEEVVKKVAGSLGMLIRGIEAKTLQAKNVSVTIINVIVSSDENMQLSNTQEQALKDFFSNTYGIEIKNNKGDLIATISMKPTEQTENKSFSVCRRLMVIGAIAAAAYAAYYSNSTPWFAAHVDGLFGKVSDWSAGLRNWFSTK